MIKVIPEQLLQASDELRRQLQLLSKEEQRLAEIEHKLSQMSPMEKITVAIRQERRRIEEAGNRLRDAQRVLQQIGLDYRCAEQRVRSAAEQVQVPQLKPVLFRVDGVDVSDIPLH